MRALLLAVLLLAAPAARAASDPLEKSFAKVDARIAAQDYTVAETLLEDIDKGLESRDPRRARLWERRGAVRLLQGRIGEAREAFTSALRLLQARGGDPQTMARAYAGMGLCLERQGKKPFALRFFKKALTGSPDEGTKMFLEDRIREIESGAD